MARPAFNEKEARKVFPELSKKFADSKSFKLAVSIQRKREKYPDVSSQHLKNSDFLKAIKGQKAGKTSTFNSKIPASLEMAYQSALDEIEVKVKEYIKTLIKELDEKVKKVKF